MLICKSFPSHAVVSSEKTAALIVLSYRSLTDKITKHQVQLS